MVIGLSGVIQSVIMRAHKQYRIDDREAGVRFVNHEYDYRQNLANRTISVDF